MKNKRSQTGLAILAGGLSFVGSAHALDLVIDGSYESATNVVSSVVRSGGQADPGLDGGWTTFTTYLYSAGYTQAGTAGSGLVFLRPYSPNQTVRQTNTLTRAISAAQIDSSSGQYNVSAWFSTYLAQNDWSDLTLQFLDGSFNGVGSPVILGSQAFVAALPGGTGVRAWGQDAKNGLVPPGARYASITTVSHNGAAGLPDGYVDLVKLDVTAGFVTIQLASATPANNATNVAPGVVVQAKLTDGTAALNTNSVQLLFDGVPVTPTIQKAGLTTTIEYDPPGLLAPLSAHSYRLTFNNSGGAVANTTNQNAFTVGPWVNINLGAPIHLETFDGVAEGALPSGWSVTNNTDPNVSGLDLNDVLSDSYLDWVVISRGRLDNLIASNTADFMFATNVAPNQVFNNSPVTALISNNFIFAVSDREDFQKQIQYLFTGDYNLTGQTNVYLSFHNIYIQNQDYLGSIEYSINGGATWLPARYLLDGPDILRDAQGNIDASNTFATTHGDVPDVDANAVIDGYYGRYIGVDSNLWSTLGAYIEPRLDDNTVDSMRVELIRLAQADNQAAVRFRFAAVGVYSWYFGIDDFGLYSVTNPAAPYLPSGPTPAALTVAAGNAAQLTIASALGVGPISYQWRRNGVDLPGRTNQTLVFPVAQVSDNGSYDVVVTGPGGSVTGAPPAVLTVINPTVLVTGQWDFNNSNLVATCGADLQYFDATVAADTIFGSASALGISEINGQPTTVMFFNPSLNSWGGYKMFHGAAPNGGGAFVNQYTIIMDIYRPSITSASWHSLLQTGVGNTGDGDVFINPAGGIGISSVYNGNIGLDTWRRVAFAFDLSGPGQAPVLTKFIDGVKVGNQTTGLSSPDGRFSLGPFALLFADESGDNDDLYVSSVQFSNGRRPDAFIAALGGPSAAKIPGCINATLQGSNIVISWTGGVPLEGADNVTGPWSTVSGATSPYTVPSPGAQKFYRPKIF